jgi:hypothetical protein
MADAFIEDCCGCRWNLRRFPRTDDFMRWERIQVCLSHIEEKLIKLAYFHDGVRHGR